VLGLVRTRPNLQAGIGAWSRFRAHLSAFSARRFHQIASQAALNLVRTAGVEPTPPEWRSGTLPLSHVRMVRPRGFEPLVGRPACFTDAGFTDRWQERDARLFGKASLKLRRAAFAFKRGLPAEAPKRRDRDDEAGTAVAVPTFKKAAERYFAVHGLPLAPKSCTAGDLTYPRHSCRRDRHSGGA
jgi:hypothetical protein